MLGIWSRTFSFLKVFCNFIIIIIFCLSSTVLKYCRYMSAYSTDLQTDCVNQNSSEKQTQEIYTHTYLTIASESTELEKFILQLT